MPQTQEEIDLVVRSTVESIVASVRANCTPSSEAYKAGGDHLIGAVANWIENPPEWVKSTWADQARHDAERQAAATK
jgi:hypothetical protein